MSPGFGWTEMLVVGVVILMVLGPERLPELARTVRESLEVMRSEMNGNDAASKDDRTAREAAAPEPESLTDEGVHGFQ